MRLFVAVNFSDEIKAKILMIQDQLRSQTIKGNFTRPENLHLTLAFLGETGPEPVGNPASRLCEIMDGMGIVPFNVSFNRTGCFTHSRKELWWIGAEPTCPGLPLLKAIHDQLVHGFKEDGFCVSLSPFNAHITLGREIKHTTPIVLNSPDIVVRVDRISLMKSEHIGGILTYTELIQKKLEGRVS